MQKQARGFHFKYVMQENKILTFWGLLQGMWIEAKYFSMSYFWDKWCWRDFNDCWSPLGISRHKI